MSEPQTSVMAMSPERANKLKAEQIDNLFTYHAPTEEQKKSLFSDLLECKRAL